MSSQVTVKNFASRNRRNQSEFRKHQLIEATMDCIDRLGLSQTTLARIAERAGISQGNVVFHFHNKEALLDHNGDAAVDITDAIGRKNMQSPQDQRLVRVLGRVALAAEIHARLRRQ